MTLENVTSTVWGLSLAGPGNIVQGVNEINQTIGIIICTQPGSDCFRPLFGCGLPLLIDRPSNIVAPQMAQSMATALRVWEPRIEVLKIKYTIANGGSQIIFNLVWKLRLGATFGQLDLLVGLTDNIANIALIPDTTPYLSGVISTEAFEPLVTEDQKGLQA